MSSKPKQSAESKELERIQIEREKQLRVENARQTTKTFSDNIAFRKKLRGIFSLLSAGFAGFPRGLGAGGGRTFSGASSASAGGGGYAGGLGGGGTQPRSSQGGGGGGGGGGGRPPGERLPRKGGVYQ